MCRLTRVVHNCSSCPAVPYKRLFRGTLTPSGTTCIPSTSLSASYVPCFLCATLSGWITGQRCTPQSSPIECHAHTHAVGQLGTRALPCHQRTGAGANDAVAACGRAGLAGNILLPEVQAQLPAAGNVDGWRGGRDCCWRRLVAASWAVRLAGPVSRKTQVDHVVGNLVEQGTSIRCGIFGVTGMLMQAFDVGIEALLPQALSAQVWAVVAPAM